MNAPLSIRLAENGWIPEFLVRWGIRRLVGERNASLPPLNGAPLEPYTLDFITQMNRSEVAVLTEKANEQHYELPAEFFELVLGRQRKYSCCLWKPETQSLDEAEELSLALTAEHADLRDGQTVLELGCGWGSLSLWMARHYPNSTILGVSNSNSQRESIMARAHAEGLKNIEIVTCDMNDFSTEKHFDRVVSVEMFEHMRNWQALMTRIAGWLKPEGQFFMHVFTHAKAPYLFEVKDANDWMSEYFFSGGMMPSLDLAPRVATDLRLEAQWTISGEHYRKTSDAWLANMEQNRDRVMAILASTYGAKQTQLWWHRWRIFFMACSELFGYDQGKVWPIGHYRFSQSNSSQTP